MSDQEEINKIAAAIEAQGIRVREMKAAKATKEEIQEQVAVLLKLKSQYKETAGQDYAPAGAASSDNNKKSKKTKEQTPSTKAKGEGDATGAPATSSNKAQNTQKTQQSSTSTSATPTATESTPATDGITRIYLTDCAGIEALKCFLVAELVSASTDGKSTEPIEFVAKIPPTVRAQIPGNVPALTVGKLLVFGANAVCRYLARNDSTMGVLSQSLTVEALLDMEECSLYPAVQQKDIQAVHAALAALEAHSTLSSLPLPYHLLYPTLKEAFELIPAADATKYTQLQGLVNAISKSQYLTTAKDKLSNITKGSAGGAGGETGSGSNEPKKMSKMEKKASKKAAAAAATAAQSGGGSKFTNDDVIKPVLPDTIDWESAGLMSALKIIFTAAITATFPQLKSVAATAAEDAGAANTVTNTTSSTSSSGSGSSSSSSSSSSNPMLEASVFRCANPTFGDFQCNNAMAISKQLKSLADYQGPISPKDVAERIICGIPENQPLISSVSCAPNGFINIKIATETITKTISDIVSGGLKPPFLPHRKVLVDFSSPNIAKEMHVGHLRSTIIGDSVCRIFEFLNFEVMRVNHVGDWGTQFGMLITYLQEAYPDILTNPPNITDLTAIYKDSKKRFDADEAFKETARLNVVKLQSGDDGCTKIWKLLCNISRAEFQKVYDALDVKLTEVGESFYNPLIPGTIEELRSLGLVQEDEGMLVIRLPHFTIPLIVRKSDGGYGYDSTDMAALKHRLHTLHRDWVVIITDAGQANHFYMCFDAARAAGWVRKEGATDQQPTQQPPQQLDHIGFGVVQGDDGKRFKTRSSETVRLIDLLDAAKERMRAALIERVKEGKSPLQGEELEHAAKVIGYGAVKYFDLKQNPSTDYIFSYDRMLDTRGDTAVYLLFAFARLVSILTKAQKEKQVDIEALFRSVAFSAIFVDNPAERALAFELLQFGDVLQSVIKDLQPNRLCDYLKEVAVKFTDFVTKCHVLNPPEGDSMMRSRLVLCAATRRVMEKCFSLLGIGTLERI